MADLQFSYVAIDRAGRRVRGVVSAYDDASAFDLLKRDGFSPLRLKPKAGAKAPPVQRPLKTRETSEFLSSLAALLAAGADIRTALGILGARTDRSGVRPVAEALAADIGGGEPLDRAFARAFGGGQAFVAPMIAAGEASGDLPGAMQRASEIIASRLKLRDQLASVLAYPAFVLLSAVAALFVILLVIVPAIAPLARDLGAEPPFAMKVMIAASDGLHAYGEMMGLAVLAGLVALLLAARGGLLARPVERLLLDGPARRTVSGLTYGAFAVTLGTMISAGAPIAEALKLALRSTPSGARRRLEPVVQAVRQGDDLSSALARVPGFPATVVRLTAVGEASNAVGALLARSGRMEEEAGLRRIEAAGRVAGPALIVILGLVLGVLMGSLLTGVSQMGQAALG